MGFPPKTRNPSVIRSLNPFGETDTFGQTFNPMNQTKLLVNGKSYTLDLDPQMPLLWAIRDFVGLKGTKFGCGIAQCGACTVHLDGQPVRSCVVPVAAVRGQRITTIEGIGTPDHLHAVQQAWIDEQVPQCGYCQSGQIMAAVSLLKMKPNPTDEDIDNAMTNLCRCGTYLRIRKAIHRAAEALQAAPKTAPAKTVKAAGTVGK